MPPPKDREILPLPDLKLKLYSRDELTQKVKEHEGLLLCGH